MHDDHAGDETAEHNANHIINENSVQDKLLSGLAGLVMVAIFLLGCYWEALPLSPVQAEEQSVIE